MRVHRVTAGCMATLEPFNAFQVDFRAVSQEVLVGDFLGFQVGSMVGCKTFMGCLTGFQDV